MSEEFIPNIETKCIVTGEVTKDKCKNKPLSRNGRVKVKEYLQKIEDYAKETGIPYRYSTNMAMEDLSKGIDFVEESKKITQKVRDEIKNQKAEQSGEDSNEGS